MRAVTLPLDDWRHQYRDYYARWDSLARWIRWINRTGSPLWPQ